LSLLDFDQGMMILNIIAEAAEAGRDIRAAIACLVTLFLFDIIHNHTESSVTKQVFMKKGSRTMCKAL
jgi:hypothetical protein